MRTLFLVIAIVCAAIVSLLGEETPRISIDVLRFSPDSGELSFRVVNKSGSAYFVEIGALSHPGVSLSSPEAGSIAFGGDWIVVPKERTFFLLRERSDGEPQQGLSKVIQTKLKFVEDLKKEDWKAGKMKLDFLVTGFTWGGTEAFTTTVTVRIPFSGVARRESSSPPESLGKKGANKSRLDNPLPRRESEIEP